MIKQGKAGYPVYHVMLHCAGIKTGQFKGWLPVQVWSIINEWHVKRGWSGFGYHGLFMPDGLFRHGRPFDMIGAGAIGHNRGVIHLLMIESKEVGNLVTRADGTKTRVLGSFSDYFTEEQRASVKSLIRSLPGITRVSGHNDHAAKLCPGFKVQSSDWL